MKNKAQKLATAALVFGLTLTSFPFHTYALTKNETVYSKLNNDGSVKSILVNEQIINNTNIESIKDYTELDNILNVGNDNKYQIDNRNITWDAKGKDIFYQGTMKKELPIKTAISYKLDGKEQSVNDMLGKSGKVTITLKYTNTDSHIINVNGYRETVYTPFVIAMGTVIDSNNNTNVSVTNGKVVNNGAKNVVAAISTPGLYESLGIEELRGMDTITISYDTTKFELASIYSVVTPKLIDSKDLQIFNKMDSIYSQVDLLQSNMNTIEDGSKKLMTGSNELKSKLGLSLETMSKDKQDALSKEQIAYIKSQTINNTKEKFTNEYKQLIANNAWIEVAKNMNSNDPKVVGMVTSSVTNAVVEYLKSVNEYNDYVNCEIGQQKIKQGYPISTEEKTSCIVISKDTTLPYVKQAATTSSSQTAQNVAGYVAENVSKQVAVSTSEQTAQTVAGSVAETLAPQIANQVKEQAVQSLQSSLETLYEGIEKIDSGIVDLSTGISKFNTEGINKICTLVNMNLKSTTNKLKSLTNISNNYESFANKTSEESGETKFILVIDSLKVKENKNKNQKEEVKISFWQRIKNLFK